MALREYLDKNGVSTLWAKIKSSFVANVDYSAANGLTKTKNGDTNTLFTLSGLKTDMSLNNVDNTSDANKPISTATQTALDGKVPTSRKVAGHALTADITLSKSDVGLGNVDNTADANKVVASAGKLTTATSIDGVSFDGSSAIAHYAVCETAGATAAKAVTCTGFSYVNGAWIAIRFNSVNSASNVTLNVNSLGAKPVYYRGSQLSQSGMTGAANRVYLFVYASNIFHLVGDLDTDTEYTNTDFGNGYFVANAQPSSDTYTVTTTRFTLVEDGRVSVRFPSAVTIATPKLNIGDTGAKDIYYDGEALNPSAVTASNAVIQPGAVVTMVYNGVGYYITAIEYPERIIVPGYQIDSTGGNSTKQIRMSGYSLTSGSVFPVTFTSANTATSGLSLQINGTTSKSLYINGSASSSSNNTLPAGTYLVYYDGTRYYVRTDGKYPGALTDNNYVTHLYVGAAGAASNSATTNGNTYIKLYDNSTGRESHKIYGTGATTVVSNAAGEIIIDSTNTTYSAMSQSEATTGTATTGRLMTAAVLSTTIDNKISAAQIGAATFQGAVDNSSTISGSNYKKGWYWLVNTAGTYVGQTCEKGDMIFAINDKGSAYATTDFTVVQTNINPSIYLTNVAWDDTNQKFTKTVNGTTSDIVSFERITDTWINALS